MASVPSDRSAGRDTNDPGRAAVGPAQSTMCTSQQAARHAPAGRGEERDSKQATKTKGI